MADVNAPTLFHFEQDIALQEAPQPLPVGTYRAVIRNVVAAPGKRDPSSHNAEVHFHISPDQYPVDYTEGEADGTTLRYYVSLANRPQSRYALRGFLTAIQAPMGREIDLTSWLGLECMVRVEHEEYEGRMMARVGRNGISPA
jgi:hypothetical protein